MPQHFTCLRGHQWQEPANPSSWETLACPVCGSTASAADTAADARPLSAGGPEELPPPPLPQAGPRWPTIPGFEILGELGKGGMGIVYKARQLNLNRLVALKRILSGSHADVEETARFRREAEAAAQLQHPNIVHVYDIREPDGCLYCSLEFVEGGSLDKRLTGQPLPPRQAAELVEVLARAIHFAHQHGIIHRDLKPANVLLTQDGTPKITDFGLAKRIDVPADQTPTGAILGTPSYMAPEQARGQVKAIGPAADVYALGVILYELLTGRRPFQAATVLELLQQVVSQGPVPPSRLESSVPADLEAICLKCLEKEPARRYGSAQELANQLRAWLAAQPLPLQTACPEGAVTPETLPPGQGQKRHPVPPGPQAGTHPRPAQRLARRTDGQRHRDGADGRGGRRRHPGQSGAFFSPPPMPTVPVPAPIPAGAGAPGPLAAAAPPAPRPVPRAQERVIPAGVMMIHLQALIRTGLLIALVVGLVIGCALYLPAIGEYVVKVYDKIPHPTRSERPSGPQSATHRFERPSGPQSTPSFSP
jgi:serine/threonine protein kinase